MANVTTTTAAVFIPEVWSADILRHVRSNLVMANLVKRYDQDVKNGGDLIHVPNLAKMTARNKSASTDITYDAATEAENTISINKHKYSAVKIEDIVKVQSRYDLREEYTSAMGYAIAVAVDSDLLALYSGLSQTVTAGASIDDADVIDAIQFLDLADAPRDNRSFVINPEAMADLRNLDKFTRYDATGQQGIQTGNKKGLVANVYGVDVYMSTNVTEEAGSPNFLHNLMFHKEAFALAMQMAPKVEAEYSVDALGWKVAAHEIYGVAELRDTFAVDVRLNS